MSTIRQTIFSGMQSLRQRASGRGRLRELLSDGRWHTADECAAVAGRRYGARIWELRRGDDGLPVVYVQAQPRCVGDGTWAYRQVPCQDCEGRRCGPECDPVCQIAAGGAP